MTVAAFINHQMQTLRDHAEYASLKAAGTGDRDSADAFERIGIAIDACLVSIKSDLAVADARVGLMEAR